MFTENNQILCQIFSETLLSEFLLNV